MKKSCPSRNYEGCREIKETGSREKRRAVVTVFGKPNPRSSAAGEGKKNFTNILDNCFLINYYAPVDKMMPAANTTRITPSSLQTHIGFWMRFVSNHVSHAFARKLLSSGVTVAEWVVLRETYTEESLAPSRLAELTGLTRGAISKLVDRLYEKKLLTRQECAGDRRYQDISLTPAGRRMVPALAALADKNDEEFFASLSARERAALIATLKKLVEANGLSKIPTE